MPRSQQIVTALKGGEVSPTIYGRVETDQYPYFCSVLENCFVHKHGGAITRGGMHFVLPTKYPAQDSNLIEFKFSDEDSYIMEFGDYYVRFFKNSGYVEDVGNVISYIGDGTSTEFVYPYADTDMGDIKLYDKDGVEIVAGFTIAAINPATNYLPAFTDAAWLPDYDSDGVSWTLSTTEYSSVNGAVLGIADAVVPVGGAYKFSVDVISAALTDTTYSDTDATDIALTSGADYVEVVGFDITDSHLGDILVDYTFETEDTSGTQTSNFYWQLRKDSEILESGSAASVGTTATQATVGLVVSNIYAGERISLHVRAEGNHASSVPKVMGTTTTASVSTTFQTNANAKLNYDLTPKNSLRNNTGITASAGTLSILNDTEESYFPAPLEVVFEADEGLDVTLDNPSLTLNGTGWVVTFSVAPTANEHFSIVDSTLADVAEGIAAPSVVGAYGEVFEIASPYPKEEIEDLYFAQANDVMIFANEWQKPWRLTRWGAYDWRWDVPTMTGAPWEDGGYDPLDGYPRTVVFFQERLVFGGTVAQPQTLWLSRTADFYDFTLPAPAAAYAADDPLEYTLAAYTHDAIEWLSSESILVIGTGSNEYRLDPDGYIASDRAPTVSRMTQFGGAHLLPMYMGGLTCFVHSSHSQLRSFKQDSSYYNEEYESINLGWTSEHLFDLTIKQPKYALLPHAVGVIPRADGVLLSATYDPSSSRDDMRDIGWARQITDGLFINVASIPHANRDQIWAIVDRQIDGAVTRYIEYMDDTMFLDSALTYPPDSVNIYPPLQSVGGLGHLEGKEVSVVADGAVHPNVTVTGGAVTLNYEASNIVIGLPFTNKIVLMPHEGGNPSGTAQGMKKRWIDIMARVVDSANPKINGKRAPERDPDTPMNTRQPNATRIVRSINLGFDREGQVTIEQDLPLYFHVLSVFGHYEVHST